MPAVLLARAKEVRDDGSIVEIVIWEFPEPLPPVATGTNTGCTTERQEEPAFATTTNGARAITATWETTKRRTSSPQWSSCSRIFSRM
jgi:hypothetical protein